MREWLVVQSMLGELTTAATHFRRVLVESDSRTKTALKSLRTLERDLDRALNQLLQGSDEEDDRVRATESDGLGPSIDAPQPTRES